MIEMANRTIECFELVCVQCMGQHSPVRGYLYASAFRSSNAGEGT